MVHELNMQLRWPHICNWILLFQLTVSRPHAEMAWLGTCLHIYGYRALLQSNTSSLLWLEEGPGIGLHCQGMAAGQETSNFCLAPADVDFAPPKGAGRLLSATPVKCHILGTEPSLWQSTDEFWSPTHTQGWSIHPVALSLLGLCVITDPYGDWHGGQGPQ